MADYDFAKELIKPNSGLQEDEEKPQTRPLTVDFASQLLSGEKKPEQFLPIRSGAKAVSDVSKGADLLTSFVGGVPTDKKASIKYFAEKRGIPENRYRIIDGEVAYLGDDGKFYKEIAGVGSSLAYYAPDVLEAAPEVAAGILTAPMVLGGPAGLATSAAITGGVSSAANMARQQVGRAISGQEISPAQTAISGLLGAGTQMIPGGVAKVTERNLVRDIASIDETALRKLVSESQKQGIELTPAELTNLSSLMGQQRVVGNIPASSKTMQTFYEDRETQQIQPAVERFLEGISPTSDIAEAGAKGQTALVASKKALEDARENASEPFYKEAFDASVPVNVKPIVDRIDTMLKTAKGSQKTKLLKFKDLLYTEKPRFDAEGNEIMAKVLDDRLPSLQNAKFEMDREFKDEVFGSMDAKIQAQLTGLQKDLVAAMGKNNPKYLEANKVFADYSKPLDEFATSKSGMSLTAMSRDNLNQFADRLFESNSVSAINYAKQQIKSADPEAWNAVTRAFLQKQWQQAKKPSARQQGMKLDTGGTWANMLFGDMERQKALRAALEPAQYQALRDLSQVLESAAKVKKLGSDTAFNAEIMKQMKDQAKGDPLAMAALGAGTVLQPQNWGAKISEWAVERRFANDADKIAQIITSPDGIKKLRELRQMSPTSARTWAKGAQLLNMYGILEAKE